MMIRSAQTRTPHSLQWLIGCLVRLLIGVLGAGIFSGSALGQTQDQSLSWTSPASGTLLVPGLSYQLEATASSGLPVTFRVARGPAAIADGRVTATQVGMIELVAEQVGDGDFSRVSETRRFNEARVHLAAMGEWPGIPRGAANDVVVVGIHAYVATDSGLVVFEVRDDARPVRIGGVRSGGMPQTLQIVGHHAYVVTRHAELQVFDVGDPSRPVLVGYHRLMGSPTGIAVVDRLAYVAIGSIGLEIFEISRPDRPLRLSLTGISNGAEAVAVVGEFAYLATGDTGLKIMDVRNPAKPFQVAQYSASARTRDVQVIGNLAYLAVGFDGIEVVDVSDSTRPVRLGSSSTGGDALAIHVGGGVAYVANAAGSLRTVDVQDPARPTLLGELVAGRETRGVFAAGSRVYVASGYEGVRIVDASVPAAPRRIGTVATAGRARQVQRVGHLTFVADRSEGIQVIDLKDPSAPTLIGNFETEDEAFGMAVVGQTAYVAAGVEGLVILDARDPRRLTRLGKLATGGSAFAVQVQGNLAYIGDSAGFQVIDIEDGTRPARMGGFDAGGPVLGFHVTGGFAYVAARNRGMLILDVRQPTRPVLVGELPALGEIYDVKLLAEYAYAVVAGRGVVIMDVRDPANPAEVGILGNRLNQLTLQESGKELCAMSDEGDFLVVGMEDPQRPIRMGNLGSGSPLTLVWPLADPAILASPDRGIQVGRMLEGIPDSVRVELPSGVWVTNGPVILPLAASAASGSPVRFRVIRGPGMMDGTNLIVTNAGVVAVRAETVGSAQFLPKSEEHAIQCLKILQSIVFNPPERVSIVKPVLELAATATSGLPVTFTLVRGPARLTGTQLTLTNVGAVVVLAEQGGDAAHAAANSVVRTIESIDPPSIQEQPTPTNVVAGSAVVLRATVRVSEPTAFQWFHNGAMVPGATSAALALTGVQATNAGLYQLVVSNRYGSVSSSAVSVTADLPGSEIVLRRRGHVPLRGVPTRSNPAQIELSDHHAFVAHQQLRALQIFDVADADSIQLVATVPFLGPNHEDLAWADGFLLLAERENGLGIVDVREPARPVRLPTFTFPGNRSDVVTVLVRDRFAYVGNGGYGLSVLDIRDPSQPVVLGKLDTSGVAAGVQPKGDLALVADWWGGLKFADVSSPAMPKLLGRFPTTDSFGQSYYGLAARDRAAYVADPSAGLLTLDWSGLPAIRLTQTVPGSFWGLQLAGRFLFAADNGRTNGVRPTGGLRVFDVNNPTNPAPVGRFADLGPLDGLRVRGNQLFVAGARFGIIDISVQPTAPQVVEQPKAQARRAGEAAFLEVAAMGGEPMVYQWFRGGQPVPRATNATLFLDPVEEHNAGSYEVEVRNPLGTVRSDSVKIGLTQVLEWVTPDTNLVLRLNQSYPVAAVASSRLPVEIRVGSGPATIADGKVMVTNVGKVRLEARQQGNSVYLPVVSEWIFNFPSMQLTERGIWPSVPRGYARKVWPVGQQVYVANDLGGVAIYDVANPANPIGSGVLETAGRATDIQVVDGIAYALDSDEGLVIFDVSDVIRPVRVGVIRLEGQVNALSVLGGRAYIAVGTEGLQIVDVSNPARPLMMGRCQTSGTAGYVEVVGTTAYVVNNGSSWVTVDVSDPHMPVVSGMDPDPGNTGCHSLRLRGALAGLTRGDQGVVFYQADPAGALARRSSLEIDGHAVGIDLQGSWAFVAAGDAGLRVVDLKDPDLPIHVAGFSTGGFASAVRVSGNYAYLACGIRGLVIVDVSSPSSPRRIASVSTAGQALAVRVVNGVAYLADGIGGFRLLDVQDSTRPFMLGEFATQDEWNGGVLDVAVEGNVASVADGFAGFHLLSVSDPTHPVRLGGLRVDHARTIATTAGRSYVSGHRLHSIDVSDLTAPVLMGSTSIAGAGFDVMVSGGTAFVAGPYYLRLFDVSGPRAPVALGELSIVDARDGSAVEVRADRAYLAAGSAGLLVVDVSDPLKPNRLGGLKTAGNAVGVKLVEDLAYVAAGTGGLQVIDVGNPTNPISVVTFSVPGFVTDAEVIGSTIYLTDKDRGLRILEARLGSPQTLLRSLPAVVSTSDSPLVLPPMSEAGLPVRYSTVSGPATLIGNQLILTGPGTVTIRAEQAGDAQFLPASIERTFNVVVTPRLSIRARGDGVRLDWPAWAVDYSLEFLERLGTDAAWQSVVLPVEEIGEVRSVEVKASEGTRFYRLRRR